MTLYLRTDKNKTVVDIEISQGKDGVDVHSFVCIPEYSNILRRQFNQGNEQTVIEDFEFLSEIRRWYFEMYLEQTAVPVTKQIVVKEITKKLKEIGIKYGLSVVGD